MRNLLFLLFLSVANFCSAQDNSLLKYKKHFVTDLKAWTRTIVNFDLPAFKAKDTLTFDNNYEQDFNYYKEFLSTYKPIITYSPDSSKFIDIYSYQLNLEKKGDYYHANIAFDQAILLCDPQKKYWDRIYFGTGFHWIEEVTWLSNTKFILVGITSSGGKRNPHILLGDTDKQTLVKYLTTDMNISQTDKGYSSPKMKRIKIKGL